LGLGLGLGSGLGLGLGHDAPKRISAVSSHSSVTACAG
jgi:hypothetical protein